MCILPNKNINPVVNFVWRSSGVVTTDGYAAGIEEEHKHFYTHTLT